MRGPKRAFGSEKVVWTGWMLGPDGVEEPNQDMVGYVTSDKHQDACSPDAAGCA